LQKDSKNMQAAKILKHKINSGELTTGAMASFCIAEPIMLLEATLKTSVASLKAGLEYCPPAGDAPLP